MKPKARLYQRRHRKRSKLKCKGNIERKETIEWQASRGEGKRESVLSREAGLVVWIVSKYLRMKEQPSRGPSRPDTDSGDGARLGAG